MSEIIKVSEVTLANGRKVWYPEDVSGPPTLASPTGRLGTVEVKGGYGYVVTTHSGHTFSCDDYQYRCICDWLTVETICPFVKVPSGGWHPIQSVRACSDVSSEPISEIKQGAYLAHTTAGRSFNCTQSQYDTIQAALLAQRPVQILHKDHYGNDNWLDVRNVSLSHTPRKKWITDFKIAEPEEPDSYALGVVFKPKGKVYYYHCTKEQYEAFKCGDTCGVLSPHTGATRVKIVDKTLCLPGAHDNWIFDFPLYPYVQCQYSNNDSATVYTYSLTEAQLKMILERGHRPIRNKTVLKVVGHGYDDTLPRWPIEGTIECAC